MSGNDPPFVFSVGGFVKTGETSQTTNDEAFDNTIDF